jgi:hypothetical protein
MTKANARPLAVVVVEKVGWRTGLRAVTYLAAWGLAADALGHPVSVKEYAEYWHQSLALSYKEREAFGSVWPDLVESPEVIWDRIKSQVKNRSSKAVASADVLAVRLS